MNIMDKALRETNKKSRKFLKIKKKIKRILEKWQTEKIGKKARTTLKRVIQIHIRI